MANYHIDSQFVRKPYLRGEIDRLRPQYSLHGLYRHPTRQKKGFWNCEYLLVVCPGFFLLG